MIQTCVILFRIADDKCFVLFLVCFQLEISFSLSPFCWYHISRVWFFVLSTFTFSWCFDYLYFIDVDITESDDHYTIFILLGYLHWQLLPICDCKLWENGSGVFKDMIEKIMDNTGLRPSPCGESTLLKKDFASDVPPLFVFISGDCSTKCVRFFVHIYLLYFQEF